MTDEKINSLMREFDELKNAGPLIKAYVPGFDELLKAFEGLPVYPRHRVGTLIFKSPKPARHSQRAGKVGRDLAKAVTNFTNEVGALRKALVFGQIEILLVNARREYEAGRISAYAFDQLKNRQHSLINQAGALK